MFQKIDKALFAVLLLVVIFLGIFPRAVELINHNYLFLIDQGRDYMAVKNIVVNHKLTMIGSEIGGGAAGTQGIFQGPVYYYLLSIFFILFNGDPYGGIVMMFIFSIAAIIFSYYFAFKIFKNKWYGLLFAFFVSISHPLIDQARFVWNNHPSTIFILLAFYFAYLSYKKDGRFIFLSAFFSAFIYNFEIAMAIPISISYILYVIFVLKLKVLRKYFYLLSGFILGVFPMIIFEVRHNFIGTRGILNYVFVKPQVYTVSNARYDFFGNHISVFITNFFDTFSLQNPSLAVIIFSVFLLFVVFLIFKEQDDRIKKFLQYLMFTLIVTFIVFSFLRNYVYYYYLYHLNIAYIFICVYAVYKIINLNKTYQGIKILVLVLISILAVKSINFSYANTIRDLSDYGGTAKIRGKIDAIDYIYKDAKGKPFGLFVFTPPVYTYAYDYLLWWYGERKYHYLPYQEKRGTFYLLIERDGSKPWSYKGWLETVIKIGKVIYTKKLPSNFIIQKRVI